MAAGDSKTAGISVGGIIVIAGILAIIFWSFWIGLVIVLIGLLAFGGFAKGSGISRGLLRGRPADQARRFSLRVTFPHAGPSETRGLTVTTNTKGHALRSTPTGQVRAAHPGRQVRLPCPTRQ